MSPTAGGAGATVKLSGAASQTLTADSSGNFSFTALPNGAYTVTPTNTGYSFNPPSVTVTVNGADIAGVASTAIADQTTFTISGSAGTAGAAVNLVGAASASTTADSSGNFSFAGMPSGSYTVTPSKSGFTFSPASRGIAVSGANLTVPSFTASAAAQTFTVSGTVSGSGASGATITLSGAASTSTTVNSSGAYSFAGLANGSYTVTAAKSGFTFSPASQNVTVNGSDVTVSAFSSTTVPQTFTVSGTITGSGGNDARITLSGAATATTTASSSGAYSFAGLANGSYTVTPSQVGFTFSPASQNVTVSGNNVTVPAFTTSAQTFTISGTISGGGGNSATVTLSGASSATTTANSSGAYSFSGLANGSYAIAVSKSGFTFSPATQSVSISNGNVAVPVFSSAAVAQAYTISGTIAGSGGNGATITLGGASSATTTANSSGAYTFSGLANGSYTVTANNSGFTFSPATQNVTVNGVNVTVPAFTSTAQTYRVSGTISGSGGNGATVTLSGATTATTTANSSGAYTFSDLPNGSYAVTPSNSGFTFSPSAQSVTVSDANVTVPAFTATSAATTYTISGTITPASTGSGATVTLTGSASASTTVNSSGAYSFSGLANGTYTVTPTSSNASFSPTSQSITINGANATVSAFTATATSNVIFYDDFTESSLSSDWFALNVYDGTNNEQECYTPSQDTLSGGYLVITSIAQTTSCSNTSKPYDSGAVVWSSFNFQYGTLEFRAEMPGGQGTWPAVWLLGYLCQPPNANTYNANSCNWPNPGSDEIDITEILDSNHTAVNQQIHTNASNNGCTATTSDVSQNYHVYDLVWSAGSLTWKIDGVTTCTLNESDVPSHPMYLIINTAMGGNGGGSVNNSTLPQLMHVDYVKVTQP